MRDIYLKIGCVIVDLGGKAGQNPGLREFLNNIKNVREVHKSVDSLINPTQFDWDHLEKYGLPDSHDTK